jgi:tRNA1(Val) A37 N6-methylase TrmN6
MAFQLSILQPEKGYRAGIDAVFLGASIPAQNGETVFEAGIGVGVASLCLLARCPDIHVTGLEVNARYAMMCEENAKRNRFAQSIRVVHADVKDTTRQELAHMPKHGTFNHAFANPPYHEEAKSTASPSVLKAVAHTFGEDDLELWIKIMYSMVGLRGTVTMINRADSLGKILGAMEGKLGDIRVAPLYAREGTAASRVIVQGVRGSKAPMQLLPGLVLHGEGNSFTPDAEAVLRNGAAWRLR